MMIKQLKESYKYLPRLEGEEDRTIYIRDCSNGTYELRITMYVGGTRYGAQRTLDKEEIELVTFDIEEYILQELLNKMRNHFL